MNTTLLVVALIAVAVAAMMTIVTIKVMRAERRRSDARVETLARDIHAAARPDLSQRTDPVPLAVGDLFVSAPHGTRVPGFQLGAVALAAAVAALIGAGLAASHAGVGAKASAGPTTAAPRVTPMPLELLALEHEQADDHLTVHGVVRNPARGVEVDHLTAVVLLFNQQGAFLTSGRAAVDPAALEPGAEARFAITIAGATDVGRYRVSFRMDDRVVPHVDRREGE